MDAQDVNFQLKPKDSSAFQVGSNVTVWGSVVNQKLSRCRIMLPSSGLEWIDFKNGSRSSSTPKYSYYGAGLDQGECGIVLHDVGAEDSGVVSVEVASASGGEEEKETRGASRSNRWQGQSRKRTFNEIWFSVMILMYCSTNSTNKYRWVRTHINQNLSIFFRSLLILTLPSTNALLHQQFHVHLTCRNDKHPTYCLAPETIAIGSYVLEICVLKACLVLFLVVHQLSH